MTSDLNNTKRRFIAGAVCPRCSEMDTIVMFREEGVEHRECVSCDFSERANFAVTATPGGARTGAKTKELPTRVNQVESFTAASEIQAVKILEPETK